MAATTGYQAGAESNLVTMSYGVESVWGTPPAVAFQLIRLMSETLAKKKTRTSPSELNATRARSQMVTTDASASGALNIAMSAGTFDDMFSSLFGNDWSPAVNLTGSDVSITAGPPTTLSSTTSGKFTGIVAGQFIRLAGFTNAGNNGWARVKTVTDTEHLVLDSIGGGRTIVDEAAGSPVTVKGKMLRNGTIFKSLYLEKKVNAGQFLQYPGAFVNSAQLTASTKNFMQGNFNVLAKDEVEATSSASTGAVLSAPTGRVIDVVGSGVSKLWNGTEINAVLDQVQLSPTNTGAAQEFGIGSTAAQGILEGQFAVDGTLRMYFKDFTYYDFFANETAGAFSLTVEDNAGAGYVLTLPNATIMNPGVNASGVNQPVMASFALEGNTDAVTGCMMQIDSV